MSITWLPLVQRLRIVFATDKTFNCVKPRLQVKVVVFEFGVAGLSCSEHIVVNLEVLELYHLIDDAGVHTDKHVWFWIELEQVLHLLVRKVLILQVGYQICWVKRVKDWVEFIHWCIALQFVESFLQKRVDSFTTRDLSNNLLENAIL